MKKIHFPILLILFLFFNPRAFAKIELPYVISSNMVLQRNATLKIWGKASKRENIRISFNGQILTTRANNKGDWQVILKPMRAGGPFKMTIQGDTKIELENILIGDVWICSGQSNMEMSVKQSRRAKEEIALANNPKIRLFTVQRSISARPLKNTKESSWEVCSSETIPKFSAVAYYFAKNLQKEINVPIGLIHSSWGGTGVETWTSAKGLANQEGFEEGLKELKAFDVKNYAKHRKERLLAITGVLPEKDLGMQKGNPIWAGKNQDYTRWKTMKIPQLWENAGLIDLNGILWFQTNFELSAEETEHHITVHLGRIDDSDDTYINGHRVGGMLEKYNVSRVYPIQKGVVRKGINSLVVRVEDIFLGGGFSSSEKDLYIETKTRKIPLAGLWKYKIGKGIIEKRGAANPNALPSLLFNGMISPLLSIAIKGVIWYQGEHNANRAYQYRTLFPNMIKDWRAHFKQGNFPFLFVQLANYMNVKEAPAESHWAELREAQSLTLEKLEHTGMAVIIDIGEAEDIHPKNKQDVGKRLSIAALKVGYDKNVNGSPMYDSMEIVKETIYVKWKNVGDGLRVKNKYGYVNSFSIAGADKKFYWAKAYIEDKNTVIVQCDKVKNPVAVRYAWANNPGDVNLYTVKGLPVSPFRTDTWKGVTFGNKVKY